MNVRHFSKFVALVAGAAVAAGSSWLPLAPAQEPGAGQEGASSQEEEFRLGQRETVGTDGQRMRVGDTELIFDSYFDFSETANDLFAWAYEPTISGTITDNAVLGAFGLDILASADIGGDLMIFAQNARIDGRVGGDMYGFVAELSVGSNGRIEGAMSGSAASMTINGEVGGPISMSGGVVVINGIVRGDVNLEAGELILGPEARIDGELRYESPREADIDPAQVGGGVRYFAPRAEPDDDETPAPSASRWLSLWNLLWDGWWLLSSFLVGAIALALGGDNARKPASKLTEQPALGLGFGFVIAVVFPAAAILSMILLVTIPLGLIGMAVYFAAAYLARLVAAQALGQCVLARIMGREVSAYGSLAIGLVLFYMLTNIPYVGFLIWLAAVVAGLGGIFLATRKADPDDVAPGSQAPAVGV